MPAHGPQDDADHIMFASTHGYGQSLDSSSGGYFFPGTGSTRNTRNDETARTDLKTWHNFEFDALDKSTHGEPGPHIIDMAFTGPCR